MMSSNIKVKHMDKDFEYLIGGLANGESWQLCLDKKALYEFGNKLRESCPMSDNE